jgi:hypothetical protein
MLVALMTEKKISTPSDAPLLPGLDTLSSLASAFLRQMTGSPGAPIEGVPSEGKDLDKNETNEGSSPYPEDVEIPFEERLRRARENHVLRSAFEPVAPDSFDQAYAHLARSSPKLVASGEAAYAAYASQKEAEAIKKNTLSSNSSSEDISYTRRKSGRVVPPAEVPDSRPVRTPPPFVASPDLKSLRSSAPIVNECPLPQSEEGSRTSMLIVIQELARQVGAQVPALDALNTDSSREKLLVDIRRAWGRHLAQAEPPAWGSSWMHRWSLVCDSLESSKNSLGTWAVEARGAFSSLSSWLDSAVPGVDNNPWDLPTVAIGCGVIPPPPTSVSTSLVADLQAAADLQAWVAENRTTLEKHIPFVRACLSDCLPILRENLANWGTQDPSELVWKEQALDRLVVVEARLSLSLPSSPNVLSNPETSGPRKPRR